jgi:acyl-CoA thioester hydrolase
MSEQHGRGSRQSRFKFVRPVKVAFRDLDGMRHVNHAVYLTYCETARNEYWMQVCKLKDVSEFDFVLAEVTARYHAPASLGDDLLVGVRITELRHSSFLCEAEITDAKTGRLICEVNSVQVMYDYASGKSKPISDERREQIETFEGKSLTAAPKKRR